MSQVNAGTDPALGPHVARLSDGSDLEYTWCKFIDQPSLKHLEWTEEERQQLQATVEAMHRMWTGDVCSLPPRRSSGSGSSSGSGGGGSGGHTGGGNNDPLVSLDPAQLVTPPRGYEYGYVPVVLRQSRSSHTDHNEVGSAAGVMGSGGALSDDAATSANDNQAMASMAMETDHPDDVTRMDVDVYDDEVVVAHRTVSYTVALDHGNTRVQSAAAFDGKSKTPYRRVVGGIVVEMDHPQPDQLSRPPRPKKRRKGGCDIM